VLALIRAGISLTPIATSSSTRAIINFTPHLTALIGFHYEDERGSYVYPAYYTDEVTERTNYDYLASVHGDFKGRFFYTLGGSLERYSLFGTQTSPRAGVSYYAFRRAKAFSAEPASCSTMAMACESQNFSNNLVRSTNSW